LIQPNTGLPKLEKIEIKYEVVGFELSNNFTC
jgi:hypothetical protein